MASRAVTNAGFRLLATVACALTLAACGDDDDGEAAPPPDEAVVQGGERTESTGLRRELEERIERLLSERNLNAPVIECALAELSQTVEDDELDAAVAEIRKTRKPPAEVLDAALAAGRACAGP